MVVWRGVDLHVGGGPLHGAVSLDLAFSVVGGTKPREKRSEEVKTDTSCLSDGVGSKCCRTPVLEVKGDGGSYWCPRGNGRNCRLHVPGLDEESDFAVNVGFLYTPTYAMFQTRCVTQSTMFCMIRSQSCIKNANHESRCLPPPRQTLPTAQTKTLTTSL